MSIIVINYGDGIYLEMDKMNHVSVKRIQLDDQGNTAFGVVAYPGPGMGYNLVTFTDEKKALDTFAMLANTMTKQKGSPFDEIITLTSIVEEVISEPVELKLVPEDFGKGEEETPSDEPA